MIKTAETYHVSVLLKESVDGLAIQPGGIYVDVTFGGGGHSREILRRLGADGRLFGFDQDADAESNIMNDDRFTFVRGYFFGFLPGGHASAASLFFCSTLLSRIVW